MEPKTISFVKDMLAKCGNDVERLSKFMRDSLRVGGIKECRKLIQQALQAKQPGENV